MKRYLISFLSLISLSACMTAEQAAQQRVAQEQADMETCRSYGLRPGTDGFAQCRLQIDLARQYYNNNPSYYGGYGYGYGPRYGSGIYYMSR